jgi:hypothetical protein
VAFDKSDSQETDSLETDAITFCVTIDRTSAMSLGLNVEVINRCVVIRRIIPGGLADTWNIANPSAPIKVNDQVIEVNDVRGNVDELLQALKYDGVLSIIVSRELGEASEDWEEWQCGCGRMNGPDAFYCVSCYPDDE